MSNVATYKHHKVCTGCRKLKPKTDFAFRKIARGELNSECRRCCADRKLADYHRRKAEASARP